MAKYGEKQYQADSDVFDKESINEGEEISDKAFEAQKRMNANPEVGKAYYKKYPERLGNAEKAYKSRHKEHR